MSAIKGGIGGLAISLVTVALAQYGLFEKYQMEMVPNFVAAVPAYIASLVTVTGFMMPVLYFSYWIFVGMAVGWLLGRKIIGKLLALLVVVGVSYGHYLAYLRLGDQVEAAFKAFASLF
jgi:hypothetical protein